MKIQIGKNREGGSVIAAIIFFLIVLAIAVYILWRLIPILRRLNDPAQQGINAQVTYVVASVADYDTNSSVVPKLEGTLNLSVPNVVVQDGRWYMIPPVKMEWGWLISAVSTDTNASYPVVFQRSSNLADFTDIFEIKCVGGFASCCDTNNGRAFYRLRVPQ